MFRPHVMEAWCLGHGFLKKSMIELNDLPKSGGEGQGTISRPPPPLPDLMALSASASHVNDPVANGKGNA